MAMKSAIAKRAVLAACGAAMLLLAYCGEIEEQEARWAEGLNPYEVACVFDEEESEQQGDQPVPFICIQPIFAAKCADCHTDGNQGNVTVGNPNLNAAYESSQEPSYSAPGDTVGVASLLRILDGSMPPGIGCTGDPKRDRYNDACLTQEELDRVQGWIDSDQLFW
jgi:hypothetical protein